MRKKQIGVLLLLVICIGIACIIGKNVKHKTEVNKSEVQNGISESQSEEAVADESDITKPNLDTIESEESDILGSEPAEEVLEGPSVSIEFPQSDQNPEKENTTEKQDVKVEEADKETDNDSVEESDDENGKEVDKKPDEEKESNKETEQETQQETQQETEQETEQDDVIELPGVIVK